jgi:flagellar hook-basal body complex protein FliE
MNIEDLLDQIETTLDAGKKVSLIGRTLVDAGSIRTSIEDIRLNIPEEIKQARAIAAERREILNTARREAENTNTAAEERARDMIMRAEDKVRELVSTHEVTKRAEEEAKGVLEKAHQKAVQTTSAAQVTADEITTQAHKWAHEMRTAASNYVEDIMKNSDEVLTANVLEIRRARQSLNSAVSTAVEEENDPVK